MKINSNRFRFILLCTLFNLLFEYSARGIDVFIHKPLFILALFGIYFTYFMMLDDIIVRYKLSNFQLFLGAFLYGLFPTAFLTGNLFNTNIYLGIMFAGINIGALIWIGVFAWGVLQGVITLYFANRLCSRDWDHPRMGAVGWSIVISYQLLMIFLARSNPLTPQGTPIGYLSLGFLIIISVNLFIKSIRKNKQEIRSFEPSKIMDFLTIGSVVLFLALGTFFISGPIIVTSQPLNVTAVVIENIWVMFCGMVFFLYRFWKGSDLVV